MCRCRLDPGQGCACSQGGGLLAIQTLVDTQVAEGLLHEPDAGQVGVYYEFSASIHLHAFLIL